MSLTRLTAWLSLCLAVHTVLAFPTEEGDEPVATDGEANSQRDHLCYEATCSDYNMWGYRCMMQAKCLDLEDPSSCIQACYAGHEVCVIMCEQDFKAIHGVCTTNCTDASIVDIYCEDNCFKEEFMKQRGSMLPDLTNQNTGVWQGIPGLDENTEWSDVFNGSDEEEEAEEAEDEEAEEAEDEEDEEE